MPKYKYIEYGAPRRSGQTFRFLLRALQLVSEGLDVVYITKKPHLVDWYLQKCVGILSAYLSKDFYTVDGKKKEIHFANNHKIRFRCGDEAARGNGYVLMDV